jgi:hypothetical protein
LPLSTSASDITDDGLPAVMLRRKIVALQQRHEAATWRNRSMRNALITLAFSAALALSGPAGANYTIDLLWADTGTKTLGNTSTMTIPAGDPSVGATGAPCSSGVLYNGSATGRCLIVRLTAAAALTASITTLGWDGATSGLAVDHVGLRSFGAFGGGLSPAAPVFPKIAGTADCSPACDTAVGSFGGLSASAFAAGVYTLGSINFDTSGVLGGNHDILNFLRTGVDGTTNKKFIVSPVQLNGAILNVVPEPGTASLLGLGIMGLVLAGRRRKA